jgi:hypothetical protein
MNLGYNGNLVHIYNILRVLVNRLGDPSQKMG